MKNKLGKILFMLVTFLCTSVTYINASTVLPSVDGTGKIVLTESVTLTDKFVVSNGNSNN